MSYNLLKGKRGIIFGALNEQSIAWKVAEKAVEEGAIITLSNTPVAVRMGEVSALAEKLNCEVIPADATSVEDLENVFKRSMEVLGGKIDFVLHSIGMSPNVRKKRTYDDLDYDMLGKTLDISAVSFHKMIQSAKKLNAINEYGSILALSYVAAQRTFYGYNDMADAKALLESIARSFGCSTLQTVCLHLAMLLLTNVLIIVSLCSLTLLRRLQCRIFTTMVVSQVLV